MALFAICERKVWGSITMNDGFGRNSKDKIVGGSKKIFGVNSSLKKNKFAFFFVCLVGRKA